MGRLSQTIQFSLIIAAFLLGTFLASFLFPLSLIERINPGYLLIGLAGCLLPLLLLKENLRLVLLVLLALGLGLLLYYYQLPIRDQSHIIFYNNQEETIRAWICQEPEQRIDQTRYQLQPINFRGKILAISSDLSSELNYGDVVEIKTKLIQPKSEEGFDYSAYLANQSIYSLVYLHQIRKIDQIKPSILGTKYYLYLIKEKLLGVKAIFLKASQRVLVEPFNALLAGLLFGTKSGLSEKLNNDFIRTGLIHIVVVSGYNISILIKVFVRYTRAWLPKFSFWLGTLAIILFVIMIGSSPPAVRAGIMAWIILWGREKGREANQLLLLLFTALIMSFFNAKLVRYDMGFQLSFLAVVGLIYFSPIIEEWLRKIRMKRWLPKIFQPYLIETLAAQTLTIPLILYTFGRISIIAPLANILVLPLVPWAMLIGFLAALIALAWPFLGQVVGWLEWLVLKYMVVATETLSKISWASLEFKWFNIYLLALVYLAIIYKIYGFQKKEKEDQ